jgi:hypothetical protein
MCKQLVVCAKFTYILVVLRNVHQSLWGAGLLEGLDLQVFGLLFEGKFRQGDNLDQSVLALRVLGLDAKWGNLKQVGCNNSHVLGHHGSALDAVLLWTTDQFETGKG